ncbi:hypothetical protein M0H32_29095, partial [Roseibium sp. CAU 1639]|nr:hypothetical protein [Roseibium sp. CAU 1639]
PRDLRNEFVAHIAKRTPNIEMRIKSQPGSRRATWGAANAYNYPEAGIVAPPGLRAHRPDLAIAGEIGDFELPDWTGEIDVVVVQGNRITSEAVLFHRSSSTAIFADLLQQFPPAWFKGWRRIVARLDLMVEREPSVPRKFRLAFTDRAAARVALQRILDWPCEKVLMAHGTPVTQNGQEFLGRAFRWLLPS